MAETAPAAVPQTTTPAQPESKPTAMPPAAVGQAPAVAQPMPEQPMQVQEPMPVDQAAPVDQLPAADQRLTPEQQAMLEQEQFEAQQQQPGMDQQFVPAPGNDETFSLEELEYLRANEVAFRWQASEFVHHEKNQNWYMMVGVVCAVLVLFAIIFHFWIEIGLFIVAAVAVVMYAKKPPRVLTYEVSPQGVSVDGRLHPYTEFRSFGVVPDLEWHTIDLDPVRRLSPRMTILFDVDDFDEIIGHLELHLPRVDREPDPVERFSRYIRF